MTFRFESNKRAAGKPVVIRYLNADGQRESFAADTKVEAGIHYMANSLMGPVWSELPCACFKPWLVTRIKARDRSEGFIGNTEVRLQRFLDAGFADKAIGEIKAEELKAFHVDISAKLAAPTAAAVCHSIDQLFREAAEEEIVSEAPSLQAFSNMQRIFARRPIHWPTEAELAAMRRAAETEFERLAIELPFEAILRDDEALALTRQDVTGDMLDVKLVRARDGSRVLPGNKARVRGISTPASLLERLVGIAGSSDDPIVPRAEGAPDLITHHSLPLALARVQRRAKIVRDGKPKYTSLMLRHGGILQRYSKTSVYNLIVEAGFASTVAFMENYGSLLFDLKDIELVEMADRGLPAFSCPPRADDPLDARALGELLLFPIRDDARLAISPDV